MMKYRVTVTWEDGIQVTQEYRTQREVNSLINAFSQALDGHTQGHRIQLRVEAL